MRRIYLIWFGKRVLPYLAAEFILFAGFMYLIGQNVYVAMVVKYASEVVIANISNPMAWLAFSGEIFIHTRLIVQLLTLGSLLMIILLFKNVVTSIGSLVLYKQERSIL